MPKSPRSIDLWWGTLSELEPDQELYFHVLSEDEKTRMKAYRFGERGRNFGLVRGWLRTVLATYFEDDPARLPIGYGAHGKPVLLQYQTISWQDRLEFNVSHCEDHFALAVTWGSKLGLDLERVRKIDRMDTIARMFFPKSDYDALRQTTERRNRRFIEMWTQFEARYKAFGREADDLEPERSVYSRTWELTPGYIASLICEREISLVRPILWKGSPKAW